MAHPRHEEVRSLYGQCCGYCRIPEESTGRQLTVDHFRPRAAGGGDELNNLVYACFRCNLFKSDFYPNVEPICDVDHRILHPLHDKINRHFYHDERTGRLISSTETGRFHIAVLQLNRPELIAYRLRNREERLKAELLRQLTAERDIQQQIIEELTAIIARYEADELDTD